MPGKYANYLGQLQEDADHGDRLSQSTLECIPSAKGAGNPSLGQRPRSANQMEGQGLKARSIGSQEPSVLRSCIARQRRVIERAFSPCC